MSEIMLNDRAAKRVLSALDSMVDQLVMALHNMREGIDDQMITETEEEAAAYQELIDAIKEQLR
jgi:hypothetical protein